jgi:hypothetical protein
MSFSVEENRKARVAKARMGCNGGFCAKCGKTGRNVLRGTKAADGRAADGAEKTRLGLFHVEHRLWCLPVWFSGEKVPLSAGLERLKPEDIGNKQVENKL